ncbi:MAG: cyclic nucleotide-binding domain-containing protein, partial [Anaerolineales bacterium]
MSLEFLRRLPLFEGLPERDLNRLLEMAEPVHFSPGQILMKEGESSGSLYIVLDGEFEITKRSSEQDIRIAVRGAGEVLGEMSLLDQSPHSASVRALRESNLLRISQDSFRELITSSSAAALAILHTVTSRLRNTEAMLRQSEKMASLGTLAAGLAHELNNPAAAARRSADQLLQAIGDWGARTRELLAIPMGDTSRKATLDLASMDHPRRDPSLHDALDRSDREQEFQDWLGGMGLEDGWQLAPILVDSGWDRARLEGVLVGQPPQVAAVLLRWLAGSFAVSQLLGEVAQSAERISEIVRAVKSYSYLDRAPVQEVDVHRGLEE